MYANYVQGQRKLNAVDVTDLCTRSHPGLDTNSNEIENPLNLVADISELQIAADDPYVDNDVERELDDDLRSFWRS
jgi:hypothetical protein